MLESSSGSVVTLNNKSCNQNKKKIKDDTERSHAFAQLFNAGPKLYSYAHCTEK